MDETMLHRRGSMVILRKPGDHQGKGAVLRPFIARLCLRLEYRYQRA